MPGDHLSRTQLAAKALARLALGIPVVGALLSKSPLPFDPVILAPEVLVAEVIMSPVETPLLRRARTHGRRIHHGRHTLDHQVPIQLDWFGIDSKGIDIVRRAWSGPLDPRLPKGTTWNSRGLIDACRPYSMLGEFPPVVKASKELREQVSAKFAAQLKKRE